MNENELPVTEISLQNIGKKYNDHRIFQGINFQISAGNKIAISGNNGSGKSTFLQIIAGYITPSEGKIEWRNQNGIIPTDKIYKNISFAGPYMELIEPFTLLENIEFFCRMKPLLSGIQAADMIQIAGLEKAAETQVQNFSSGMRQKVKLTMAFLAKSSLLLLDEPLSNLDEIGYNWYKNMSEKYLDDRTMLVCSNNVKEEIFFCKQTFQLENYK